MEVDLTKADREPLLHKLDETRKIIENLLPSIDPEKEIFRGWTIKDLLAHISGWDDTTIDSLRAHVAGREPVITAGQGINEYNCRTVASRKDLDYTHVLNEWRLNRQILRTIIKEMPDENFSIPLTLPWGQKGTVTSIVDIFHEHEEEHAKELLEWLKNPENPIGKQAN
jgi:hypothetical protein